MEAKAELKYLYFVEWDHYLVRSGLVMVTLESFEFYCSV